MSRGADASVPLPAPSGDRGSPTLGTERLVLRAMGPDDVPFVLEHFGDPAVVRHLHDSPRLRSLGEAEELVRFYLTRAPGGPNRWVVVRREDDRPIGTVGFHDHAPKHRRAEIGYDLSPHAHGHGYMAEAVRAALEHGFGTLDLHRVEAVIAVGNAASHRLVERLGFRDEGVLRAWLLQDGVFHDHRMWSLLRDEWADVAPTAGG